jgi:hypothetical protein
LAIPKARWSRLVLSWRAISWQSRVNTNDSEAQSGLHEPDRSIYRHLFGSGVTRKGRIQDPRGTIYLPTTSFGSVKLISAFERSFFFRLVQVVGCLYLNLDHATSAFSLPFNHLRSSSSLQYLAHNHISISHVSLLSPSQHHHFRLNHFRIYFVNNEFEKTY